MSRTSFMFKTSKTQCVLACFTALWVPVLYAQDKDISVGHLTYHTGEYGSFGPFFDGVADFALDVINRNPPLGRKGC